MAQIAPEERARVIAHLVKNGWPEAEAAHLVDNERDSLTFAAARFNASMRDFYDTVLASLAKAFRR